MRRSLRLLPPALWLAGLIAAAAPAAAQTAAPPPPAPSPPPAAAPVAPAKPVLTLYTSFDPARLAPVFAELEKEATVVYVVDDPDLLLGRLLREGETSPADLLLLPGAARMDRAAAAGLLRAAAAPELERIAAPGWSDPDGRWRAVALYARAVAFHPDRVKPGEIQYWTDLAKPSLKGRLCLPAASRPATRSWAAALTLRLGEPAAKEWIAAVAAAAATAPAQLDPNRPTHDVDDRALVMTLARGGCDAAVVSSRALARLADRGDEAVKAALDKLVAVYPGAEPGKPGAVMDVAAVGVAASSDRKEAVWKALALLGGEAAQRHFAEAIWATPAKPGVPLSNPVTRWGPFKPDATPLIQILAKIPDAAKLMERAGWP